MGTLKLSIALLTYNRERFLQEHLSSILGQTRLPDEVIIGDDCSTDRTPGIVRNFAAHAPFPVRWYVNDRNQGVARNAEHAINLCSGDVIVFCDDDDVCLPDRLNATEKAFQRSAATGIVTSNSDLVDDKLNPLGISLWDSARFSSQESLTVLTDPIPTLARHFLVYGHVTSFRSSLRNYILPFPPTPAVRKYFDVWVALVLASVADVACIPQALVLHRLHPGQIAGVQSLASRRERLAAIASNEREKIAEFSPLVEEVVTRISTLAKSPRATESVRSLRRWAEHMKMQSQLPRVKCARLAPVLHALLTGRYHAYSRGFLTAARDLLLLN